MTSTTPTNAPTPEADFAFYPGQPLQVKRAKPKNDLENTRAEMIEQAGAITRRAAEVVKAANATKIAPAAQAKAKSRPRVKYRPLAGVPDVRVQKGVPVRLVDPRDGNLDPTEMIALGCALTGDMINGVRGTPAAPKVREGKHKVDFTVRIRGDIQVEPSANVAERTVLDGEAVLAAAMKVIESLQQAAPAGTSAEVLNLTEASLRKAGTKVIPATQRHGRVIPHLVLARQNENAE